MEICITLLILMGLQVMRMDAQSIRREAGTTREGGHTHD